MYFRPAFLLPVIAIALAACGPAATTVTPGTTALGPVASTNAAVCPGAATTAPDIGGVNLGIYNGVILPSGWASQTKSEGDVTTRINTMAADTTPGGIVSYAIFKCSFPAAVYVFSHNGAAASTPVPSAAASAAVVAVASPASAAASVAPSVAPTPTPSPTATPTPAPAASVLFVCTPPSLSPVAATGDLGAYTGRYLPAEWAGTYGSEASITSAIGGVSLDTSTAGAIAWQNFQCNYPTAYAVFLSLTKGGPTPSPGH